MGRGKCSRDCLAVLGQDASPRSLSTCEAGEVEKQERLGTTTGGNACARACSSMPGKKQLHPPEVLVDDVLEVLGRVLQVVQHRPLDGVRPARQDRCSVNSKVRDRQQLAERWSMAHLMVWGLRSGRAQYKARSQQARQQRRQHSGGSGSSSSPVAAAQRRQQPSGNSAHMGAAEEPPVNKFGQQVR